MFKRIRILFLCAIITLSTLILFSCENMGGIANVGDTVKVTFIDGSDSFVKTVSAGEKIGEVTAPKQTEEGMVTEWDMDMDAPITESMTVYPVSYTEGLTFSLKKTDKTYQVAKYRGSALNVYIPDTYKGTTINTIGTGAFDACDTITSVRLPANLTTIADRAFYYCKSITVMTIPESVTSLGASAFDGCSSLSSINLPQGLTVISSRLLVANKVQELIIPEGVTKIEAYALAGTTKRLILPKSLEEIGKVGVWPILQEVFYCGAAEDWELIDISEEKNGDFSSRSILENVTIYFYSAEQPTEEGNYWRFVAGKVMKWN